MKFIKLCGNGSTWYLPKGLPGVLVIVDDQYDNVIYAIKSNQQGKLPEYYLDEDTYFGSYRLRSSWPYTGHSDFNNRLVPTGYAYSHQFCSYDKNKIRKDFNILAKVYYKNKGLVFYLKAKWGDLVGRILP